MGNPTVVLAGAAALALSLGTAGAESTLDGWPSKTDYLSNDAPFVVFGVTPTRLNRDATQLKLAFIATESLSAVKVFPFVRAAPGERAPLQSPVQCGPRERGYWECALPVSDLLADLQGPHGELGLRIEAHGDPRELREHSTVVVVVPVGGEDRAPPHAQTVSIGKPVTPTSARLRPPRPTSKRRPAGTQ
ncbi:MAG: hypothetical protein KF871_03800 [Hydrogenophaga sp.]|uniref:hypothetical protein n=1 Tax=Hydrogenophaga sp. TaxID=1904254 RepID=UPI001E18E553|nr:hypothetical protein [Hydrogenophaga sp.]MBX3608996.1 hypothetical protein [Hydrogenophaga sp.]